jgi:miniconductance mechanosensitive channel
MIDSPWLQLLIVVGAAVAAYLVGRYLLIPLVHATVARTKAKWDDILLDRKVLHRLSLLLPVVAFRFGLGQIDGLGGEWLRFLEGLTDSLLIVVGLVAINAAFNSFNDVYIELDIAENRPIKGYLQVVMIVLSVCGVIVIIARLTGQEIGFLLGGLGALTAVLLLVFKDTILSLVASLQIGQNDLVRVGDWIEMPHLNVDGDVIDVALHTVKVQNWDKTISTVPTYKLVSDSFRNWRGMEDAGGRRIKRAINLDVSTIRFLSEPEIQRFKRFAPLHRYMDGKAAELEHWQELHDPGPELVGDPRRLTNIGTFRAYVLAYLKAHPKLATDTMTSLVRQLPPGPHGLPLELYVFSSDTEWAKYEAIQADVFDHLLAIVPEFGLRVFQEPAGSDLRALGDNQT